MTPVPHRMPGTMFDEIAAGGGGPAAWRFLARAELSRRLACAYALTVVARKTGGRTAEEVLAAWDLLSSAARADPCGATAVLAHPTTGPALFRLLTDLMREKEREPSQGAPPWEEGRTQRRARGDSFPPATRGRAPVHWLTALAAAAAVRAGLRMRAEWPADGPWVPLPSLGRALFPGTAPGDRVEVVVDAGGRSRIAVTDPRGHRTREPVPVPIGRYGRTGRWRAAHLLGTLGEGAPLLLDVMDQAPFPNAAGPADGLGTGETPQWEAVARRAAGLLRVHHPEPYEELAAGPVMLVPLAHRGPGQTSGSSAESFGCVALSRPATATGFAVTLVHEMQHNKLAALLHLFDLLLPEGEEGYYAPWRPDPRPLVGLLHGAYAHLGVARFWERRRETATDPEVRAAAHVQFARWRLAAREATYVVLSSGRLTGLGRRFAEQTLTALDALCRLPVPAAAVHRAESAARAHRAAWRDRNGSLCRTLSA